MKRYKTENARKRLAAKRLKSESSSGTKNILVFEKGKIAESFAYTMYCICSIESKSIVFNPCLKAHAFVAANKLGGSISNQRAPRKKRELKTLSRYFFFTLGSEGVMSVKHGVRFLRHPAAVIALNSSAIF